MAATTAGAVKAWLEGSGWGIPAFRDSAPQDQKAPYFVITEGVSFDTSKGMRRGPQGTRWLREEIQIDLWQERGKEIPGIQDALMLSLEGGRGFPNIGTAPIVSVRDVTSMRFRPAPDATKVRTMFGAVLTRMANEIKLGVEPTLGAPIDYAGKKAAADAFVPTTLSETFRVPAGKQAVFALPIEIEPGGELVVDGDLEEVD